MKSVRLCYGTKLIKTLLPLLLGWLLILSNPLRAQLPAGGTLWVMGGNTKGQLGLGHTNRVAHVAAVTDGVVAVAAGYQHSLFVKADGTLWAMGLNYFGQSGGGSPDVITSPVYVTNRVTQVSAGEDHSLFLRDDNTLWGLGNDGFGQIGVVPGSAFFTPVQIATNVISMAAGWNHSVFVKADGTLWAMGDGGYGQLGLGELTRANVPTLVASNVVQVAAGSWHSVFVKSDGTLWGMGNNVRGPLGTTGFDSHRTPVKVADGVIDAVAGGALTLFRTTNGQRGVAGENIFGQQGTGLDGWSDFGTLGPSLIGQAAGFQHSLFLLPGDALWAAGANAEGQLGDGTTNRTSFMVYVDTNVTAVAAGGFHSLFVGAAPGPPAIHRQPESGLAAGMGNTVSLSVTAPRATGFQWYLDETNILVGATNTTIRLTNLTRTNTGAYSVTATNAHGSVRSRPAAVRVYVQVQLAAPTLQSGGGIRFSFGDSDGGTLRDRDLPSFEVQAGNSPNRTNWLRLTNGFTLTNGAVVIEDTDATNHVRRFYRVLER